MLKESGVPYKEAELHHWCSGYWRLAASHSNSTSLEMLREKMWVFLFRSTTKRTISIGLPLCHAATCACVVRNTLKKVRPTMRGERTPRISSRLKSLMEVQRKWLVQSGSNVECWMGDNREVIAWAPPMRSRQLSGSVSPSRLQHQRVGGACLRNSFYQCIKHENEVR